MRNLTIIKKILIINIIIMTLYFLTFFINSQSIVSKQLSIISDKKIESLYQTIKPIISINLTLGMEENYVSILNNTLKVHEEIISITLLNNNGEALYMVSKDNKLSNASVYENTIIDSLLNEEIGKIKFYYKISNDFNEVMSDYTIFLVWMFIAFIIVILLLTYIINHNLTPLKNLFEKIKEYKLNKKNEFSKTNLEDEISQINNLIAEMLEKIEKEVELKIHLEQEMMKKDRFASMGEMLDNIAHQWRQPLMIINATLLNMDLEVEKNEVDKEYLKKKMKKISETTLHMSETINVFRDYINPNKTKSKFNIVESTNNVLKFLKSSMFDVSIEFNYEKEYELVGVKSEFTQVIISIINNAIEALENKHNKAILIDLVKEENNVILLIKNNGKNIKGDLIEKIFDPYFTTKHKAGGTGLGLYICKLIISNTFNGSISVSNCKDGVEFKLEFKKEDNYDKYFERV